jgi:hypothetical protein
VIVANLEGEGDIWFSHCNVKTSCKPTNQAARAKLGSDTGTKAAPLFRRKMILLL